jgi:hypothetical protein
MRRKTTAQQITPDLDQARAMPYEVNNKDKRGNEVDRGGYMKKYITHNFLFNS